MSDPNRVVIVLMKSPEADATIDALKPDYPNLKVKDNTTYWTLEGTDELVVDMDKVGDELGEPIAVHEWLVIMSSYIGRPTHEDNAFRVTSHMLQLEGSS